MIVITDLISACPKYAKNFNYTKYISSKLIICFHRSLSPLNPLKFLKEQQNPIEKLPITRISIFQNKKRPCPYTPYQSEGNKCSEVAMRGIGCVIWGSEGVIQSVSEGSLIEMLIVIGMQNTYMKLVNFTEHCIFIS